MDCKTARLLLHFTHPRTTELEADEAAALEGHLADCPQCGSLAQAERQADNRIGQAMRAVAVPEGLRTRLLAQLDAEREHWYRRRLLRVAGLVAAAAALVLIVWLGIKSKRPDSPDFTEATRQVEFVQVGGPSPETIRDWFREERGVRTVPPADLDYALLTYYDLAPLQGQRVPLLLFAAGKDGERVRTARVYILSDRQFDISNSSDQQEVGSGCLVEMRPCPTDRHLAYLIVYTGGELKPFLKPPLRDAKLNAARP
jgi:hypothetical protein